MGLSTPMPGKGTGQTDIDIHCTPMPMTAGNVGGYLGCMKRPQQGLHARDTPLSTVAAADPWHAVSSSMPGLLASASAPARHTAQL